MKKNFISGPKPPKLPNEKIRAEQKILIIIERWEVEDEFQPPASETLQ